MNGRTFWKLLRSGGDTAAVIVTALLLVVGLSGCKNAEGGGQQTGDISGQEHQEEAEPTPASYRMTNSRGEVLETVPGYSYVSCTKTLSGGDRGTSILIPPIFAYTEKDFGMGSETEENGFYELVFSYDNGTDIDFVEAYATDLSACGFTLERTWSIDSDQTIYYLNYNGSVTHGADRYWDGTVYDMSITGYRSISRTIVVFRYPPEVGFDLGNSEEEYRVFEVATNYSVRENGADTFQILGWGETPEDEIYLWFAPDRYGTGTVLEQEDFAAQTAAGASGLCHISIYGDTIAGSAGTCYVESLDAVTVTILERSDEVCVISYVIDVKNGSAAYQLEGICAAELGGGGTYTEPDSVPGSLTAGGSRNCVHCHGTGKIMCTYCNGAGFTTCHTCGGDGMEQCSLCHGTCQYWSNGGYRTCNGCYGRGTKPCSSSQCSNGKVNCSFCNNGMKTCNYCLGLGK